MAASSTRPSQCALPYLAAAAGGAAIATIGVKLFRYLSGNRRSMALQVVDIDIKGRTDEDLIRESVMIARKAVNKGNHPFGALLVHVPSRRIIATAENTVVTEKDTTGHAETNLIRIATKKFSRERLGECALYTSTEPCCMCAGAIYWAGIKRVVYGCSDTALYKISAPKPHDPALRLSSRTVFSKAQGSRVEVKGPVEEGFCREIHAEFWPKYTGEC
eukprot:jgi/Bigna1/46228/estExt_Genewise1.C_30090